MDGGNRYVRISAWALGGALRLIAWLAAAARTLWATYGGPYFLLNVGALGFSVCTALLLWWWIFDPVVPMTRSRLLAVVPETRVVDRDKHLDFVVIRRICMAHGAWATVTRYFIGTDGGGLEFKMASPSRIFFQAGCHDRSRTIVVPQTLPPGRYLYRSSVEFCNKLRCEEAWVTDIPLTVTGGWPPSVDPVAMPLPQEAL